MNRKTVKNLATVWGLGELPKAPGTFGTLGGIPIYLALLTIGHFIDNEKLFNAFYFVFLMTLFAVSVYVSDICEKEIYKKKDPQAVVIDEVLGFLTTLFLINPSTFGEGVVAIVLGFILFRFFDITKLGPINSSQNFGDGVGVVLDDFLAGIIGNFILVSIWIFIF